MRDTNAHTQTKHFSSLASYFLIVLAISVFFSLNYLSIIVCSFKEINADTDFCLAPFEFSFYQSRSFAQTSMSSFHFYVYIFFQRCLFSRAGLFFVVISVSACSLAQAVSKPLRAIKRFR